MSNTTKTHDDGRNERQRQQQSQEARGREPDDDARRRLIEEKPPDYIERTRPEDPSDRFGQQTRDNVNPNIPSGERGAGPGPIVQPESTSGGVAPPAAAQQHTEEQELAIALHVPSINEPPGSNIATGDAGPAELPPLVLSDVDPDAMVVGSGTFALTVTGSGFTQESVVVFDDADAPTTFVSQTELRADCPVSATAATVDVEVHRGDDMSDVLSFEFTAVMREGREKKPPERKPKKDTPSHKRLKGRK
jgi:hypothetical protein